MVVGQTGVVLRESSQPVIAGVATGGSLTTLVDTGKDFVTLGVQVNDVVVAWDGPGLNQRAAVSGVAATTLTLSVPITFGAGTRYFVVREPFVVVLGGLEVDHRPRVPVLDTPGRAGDSVQHLSRSSREMRTTRAQVYAGYEPSTAARDSIHVQQVHRLRSWSDAGTYVYLDSLTEIDLRVRIKYLRVVEEAGGKGFPVVVELVEA